MKRTRMQVESLRDSIKSRYNIDNEWDEEVERLMHLFVMYVVTENQFEELLIEYYENGKIGW